MMLNRVLKVVVLSLASSLAFAAGSPMNENFSNLIDMSSKAVETAKQGNAAGFVSQLNDTLVALDNQQAKGSSIRLQRGSSKLKIGLKAGKDGNLEKGITAVNEAIEIMKTEGSKL